MSSEKLWLLLAIIAGITVISVVALDDLYFTQQAQRITEMTTAGADPLRASCSLSAWHDVCKIIAGRPQ
jgi:hypothetical protein